MVYCFIYEDVLVLLLFPIALYYHDDRYGKPRAASVIALTDGKLWALNRNIFKKVVMRSMDIRKDIIRVLKNVELLKCLNLQQKQRLADLLCEEVSCSLNLSLD